MITTENDTAQTATVERYHAPSGNRDADYFKAVCLVCNWQGVLYSNRTVEGRACARRDAAQHKCKTDLKGEV